MAIFRQSKGNQDKQDVEAYKADPKNVPNHVAIIMDGNGRWAQSRGLPRIEGHRRGAKVIREVLEVCRDVGVKYLTLFCFSLENWKRPKQELDFLMGLLKSYLTDQVDELIINDTQLVVIGRREGLATDTQHALDDAIAKTQNGKSQTLCLAINYGARQEIVDAMKLIATEVRDGVQAVDDIDESVIERHLYTCGMPDPDLVVRTSGEMRISNFLLWQISYSELWITPKPWPEFEKDDFYHGLMEYSARQRRYGGIG